MNTEWILLNLRQALEGLIRTTATVEATPDYDEVEFEIALAQIYHHLNTAWNARHADPGRVAAHAEEDFFAWRAFPSDLSMEP